MKIASWNVNSLKVRLPHVLQWLADTQPDLVGLQETKTVDAAFPADALRDAGYAVVHAGQKTYNGVAVLARIDWAGWPGAFEHVMTDIPGLDDPQRRVLAVDVGGTRFINLYVPNGSEVGSEKYAYKLNWLQALHAWLGAESKQYSRLAVVGDFNIAPADADVHDPEEWRGKILFSEPEHAALDALAALGLRDTFRLFPQEEQIFSWWDYRMNNFRRNRGLRIDLILASPALQACCTASWVDKSPRRLERPSDHAPVLASFD